MFSGLTLRKTSQGFYPADATCSHPTEINEDAFESLCLKITVIQRTLDPASFHCHYAYRATAGISQRTFVAFTAALIQSARFDPVPLG